MVIKHEKRPELRTRMVTERGKRPGNQARMVTESRKRPGIEDVRGVSWPNARAAQGVWHDL